MSSDEGSNGNKRKAEESARGGPNKRVHFADALPPSGIIQDDQEEGNKGTIKYKEIEEESAHEHSPDEPSTSSGKRRGPKNVGGQVWMKYCKIIKHRGIKPKCNHCKKHYPLHIDPEPFKKHYEDVHPKNRITQDHESDWIFNYFNPLDRETPRLKCGECDWTFEVQFKGPFVDHFKEHKIGQNDVRSKAWWIRYVDKVEADLVFCNWPECDQGYRIYFTRIDKWEEHVQEHLQEQGLRRNENNFEHFLFDKYVIRCKHCDEFLPFSYSRGMIIHLERTHNLTKRERVCGPNQVTQSEINQHIKTLTKYLIDKFGQY